jgi:hypothetical protein
MVDGIPVVGHVKGGVHYALGQNDKGDACMKGASRTAAVIGAGIFTGPGGAVCAGTTFDLATTFIESGIDGGKFHPNGALMKTMDNWINRKNIAGDLVGNQFH